MDGRRWLLFEAYPTSLINDVVHAADVIAPTSSRSAKSARSATTLKLGSRHCYATSSCENQTEHRAKLDAVGYGFFIPVIFFVTSGMSLDLRSIIQSPVRLVVFPAFAVCRTRSGASQPSRPPTAKAVGARLRLHECEHSTECADDYQWDPR